MVLGVSGYLEVTVESDSTLDFSSFKIDVHAGVLLDGLADAGLIKQNREALQGRYKECRGGKSNTMMYHGSIFHFEFWGSRLVHTVADGCLL